MLVRYAVVNCKVYSHPLTFTAGYACEVCHTAGIAWVNAVVASVNTIRQRMGVSMYEAGPNASGTFR